MNVESRKPNHDISHPDVACIAPPDVANGEMEPINWDGSPIKFDTNITYRCKRGMKFRDDFEGTETMVQATCRDGNVWDLPTTIPFCVASKFS